MISLTTYHLLFTAEVTTLLDLDDHSGASLRGNLFEAVWRRFCTNKAARSCAECPLHTLCPVSALVAPLREENTRGRDISRPYIILPPLEGAHIYDRGERFIFGITLFGSIITLLPYLIMSMLEMEQNGLGQRRVENRHRRGTFRIVSIETVHPFTGERRIIYQHNHPVVHAPTIAVTAEDVRQRAQNFSPTEIALDFLTPTRIINGEQLIQHPTFRMLVLRLKERLHTIQANYGEEVLQQEPSPLPETNLVQLAEDIVCTKNSTRWEELKSYSNRQKRLIPISGFVGQLHFRGDLAPFHELLVWGELVHIGKSAVKGNGWYKVLSPPISC